MASVKSVLAGVLALGGPVSASVFRPQGPHANLHRSNDNLISVRNDAGKIDDSPIIRTQDPDVLKPIRPTDDSKSRSGKNVFAPRSKETIYWAGKSGNAAGLEVRMPGPKEGLVDSEYFEDLIDSMDCPKEGTGKVNIKFKDEDDYKSAAGFWNWVNHDADNHFVLLAGSGACGWNDDRALFDVDGADFDKGTKTVTLAANTTNWKDAIHSYDFHLGKHVAKEASKAADMGTLDDPSFNVPIDADLSGKGISFSMSGVDVIGSCNNCTTAGSFDFTAHFSVGWFELDEASVEVTTDGIDATMVMDLTLKGDITDTLLSKEFPLFKFSPAGVAIPGVVSIGPNVEIAIVAGITAIKGGTTLTVGGTSHISESSATLDFLDEDNNTSDGWEVTTEAQPLEADIFVECKATVSLTPSVGLEISAMETGFAAKLAAELPQLGALGKAIYSPTCTACDKGYSTAISGSLLIMETLSLTAQKKVADKLEDLWTLSLFNATEPPLASFCEPAGPQTCGGNNGSNPNTTATYHRPMMFLS